MPVRKNQEPPEYAPEPAPHISPEMLRDALETLEVQGMIYFSEGGAYVPTERGWKLLMSVSQTKEVVFARGSPDVSATSSKYFAVIKSKQIKTDKDAVIAVQADKSARDLNPEFKKSLTENKKIEILIEVDGIQETFYAYGSPAFKLNSENSICIRKDDLIDGRAAAILADKSAADLDKTLREKLKDPKTRVKITLEIKQ